MAQTRPVDIAVKRFLMATGAILTVVAGLQVWIYIIQDGQLTRGPNVAYTLSIVVTVALTLPILWAMKRTPADYVMTWGEAMLASTYVFFLLFWVYGVVPHQWLTYADNELGWRADRFVKGPELPGTGGQGVFELILPFKVNYVVIRDLIAVAIYGVMLVGNVALWMMWQNRGKEPAVAIEKSDYGRPLVREKDRVNA